MNMSHHKASCTNCRIELADTAKFCPECGTRKPAPMTSDERLAFEIVNAGALVSSGDPLSEKEFLEPDSLPGCMAILAKAREVLDVAKLQKDLENASHQLDYLNHAWDRLFELVPAGPNDSHPEHVNHIVYEIQRLRAQRPDVAAIKAEAKRETLNEVLADIENATPPWNSERGRGAVHYLGLLKEFVEAKRDATQPTPSKREAPAVDVEGLSRLLEKCWIEDDCKDYRDIAKAVVAYITHGGDR